MAKKKRKGQSAAFMRSINPFLKRKSHSTKLKRKKTMAKHKRRSGKKGASVLGLNIAAGLGALGYGAIRAKVATWAEPYTSKIPIGNYSDEVGMLIIATAAKKFLFKNNGILRNAMTAGQLIELARIGDGMMSGVMPNATSSSNGYVFQ